MADEVDSPFDAPEERQHALEDEVRMLKDALGTVSRDFSLVKEELKKRDQDVAEKTLAYYHLLEQFKLLRQQQLSNNMQRVHEDFKPWELRPDIGNQHLPNNNFPFRYYPLPHNHRNSPTSPNKYITDEDEDYYGHEGRVPQLLRLGQIPMSAHV
jgi:hypothetical protein